MSVLSIDCLFFDEVKWCKFYSIISWGDELTNQNHAIYCN